MTTIDLSTRVFYNQVLYHSLEQCFDYCHDNVRSACEKNAEPNREIIAEHFGNYPVYEAAPLPPPQIDAESLAGWLICEAEYNDEDGSIEYEFSEEGLELIAALNKLIAEEIDPLWCEGEPIDAETVADLYVKWLNGTSV